MQAVASVLKTIKHSVGIELLCFNKEEPAEATDLNRKRSDSTVSSKMFYDWCIVSKYIGYPIVNLVDTVGHELCKDGVEGGQVDAAGFKYVATLWRGS